MKVINIKEFSAILFFDFLKEKINLMEIFKNYKDIFVKIKEINQFFSPNYIFDNEESQDSITPQFLHANLQFANLSIKCKGKIYENLILIISENSITLDFSQSIEDLKDKLDSYNQETILETEAFLNKLLIDLTLNIIDYQPEIKSTTNKYQTFINLICQIELDEGLQLSNLLLNHQSINKIKDLKYDLNEKTKKNNDVLFENQLTEIDLHFPIDKLYEFIKSEKDDQINFPEYWFKNRHIILKYINLIDYSKRILTCVSYGISFQNIIQLLKK